MTDSIIFKTQDGSEVGLFAKHLEEFKVFVFGEIHTGMTALINAQLMYLSSVDPEREITMYIDSPGGEYYSGNSVLDMMDYIPNPVKTVCIGLAASMASIIFANGYKRQLFKRSRIMIHQPSSGVIGDATTIDVHNKETAKIKNEITDFYVEKTGNTKAKIKKAIERDTWLDANEALKFGIADEII